ncbi:hypothetical protein UCDDS831_g08555 [Diplodia seriata]|uniref:Uncharacterized protein n=1 Tax=Diplodia seriata TaxID=420778 RepID=A0A0G2DTF7_9PEZI|nr:hypothetical protein UCDDS831_g08555 [Diplodia seriata]
MNGAGSNKPPPSTHPPGPSSRDPPPSMTDPPRRRVMSRIPPFEGYHMRPSGTMPATDFNRRLYLRLDPQRIHDPGRLTPDDWIYQINAGRDPASLRPGSAGYPPRRPPVGAYSDPDLPRRRDKSYHYHCPSPPPSPPRAPPPPPPPSRSAEDEQRNTSDRDGGRNANGQKDSTSTPGSGNTKYNGNGTAGPNGTANGNTPRGGRRRPPIPAILRVLTALLLDALSTWAILCLVFKLLCGLVVGILGGGFWTRSEMVAVVWQAVGIAWDLARNGRGGGVLFGATGRAVGVGVHWRDVWSVVWVGGWVVAWVG